MEKVEVRVEGTRMNGTKIIRRFFINDDNINYLVKAQSYFTKEEKKMAKQNYKFSNYGTN